MEIDCLRPTTRLGKNVNCFTEYDIETIDQARKSADEWLAMELEEEKLRYADA